jgi:hypothetical protein
MEEALTNHLLAQAGLAALVGNRITWTRRPQGSALSAIVLHVISRTPAYTMDGPTNATPQRIQTDCWAKSYAEAKAVARQVTAALSGTHPSIGDGASPETFVDFLGSFKEGERDSFEQGAGGEALYRVGMDFIIWTRED